jgi:hypothetical protein
MVCVIDAVVFGLTIRIFAAGICID